MEECFDGAAVKFKAKYVTKSNDLGGIPAGEGDEEDADAESVINLVDTYRLTALDEYKQKDWMVIVKEVMAGVMEKIKKEGTMDKDQMKAYKKGCVEFVNFIKSKYSEIQFYQGEIGDYEGIAQSFGYCLGENPEDPLEFSFYFFRGALVDEKC
uniref:TCTP domain-containing protein n=1 Tax=Euplotes crassus TaxID=5936 RepID=A0A7S3NSG8_EUPCR